MKKINIAMRYLTPKQISNNGLRKGEIAIQDTAIRDIIRFYTREAGVRNLEREISKICRKVVKSILLDPPDQQIVVDPENLETYLSVQRFRYGLAGRTGSSRSGHWPSLD